MTVDHHDPDFLSLRLEYALGTIDGRQRSVLAHHLDECDECAREVARVADLVDTLTLSAPDAEPSGGFESRVLHSIAREARPSPRRARVILAVAATALAVLATIGVLRATSIQPAPRHATVVDLPLWSHHQKVGTVYASPGSASWVVVVSFQRSAVHHVDCVVVTTTGRLVDLGTFAYGSGASWWSALPVATDHVREIRLVSPTGSIVASSGTSHWGSWSAS